MTLEIIEGDILDITEGTIFHQVNCKGVMGAGLAKAIRAKYPSVYESYRVTCAKRDSADLYGDNTWLWVTYGIQFVVVNLFGQFDFGTKYRQTNYGALASAISRYAEDPVLPTKDHYFPYGMGCGLAGGDWEVVEEIIEWSFPRAKIVKKS